MHRGLLYGTVLWTVAICALLAPCSLLSDDWAHVATVAGFQSWLDAFDPALVPLRPLQWLEFHWFVTSGEPALARLPVFALHALGLALLYALARSLGATRLTAALALLLFAVQPQAVNLGWPAAIGWPGRHAALLLGLLAFVHHRRRPRAWSFATLLLAQLLALLSHQSGVLLPVLCALYVLATGGGRALWRCRRDPALWLLVALVLPYALYVGWLRSARMTDGVPLAALPTHLFRASIALWPQLVREPLEAAARAGGQSLALALPGAFLLPALGLWAFRRGGLPRFVALAIGVDLVFVTLAVGFLHRYALTAAAWWALGLALWATSGGRWRRLALALLVVAYAVDTGRQVRDFHRADAAVQSIRDTARATAATAPPGATLILLDVPGEVPPTGDVPLFRYGLREALRHWGLTRPVALWTSPGVRRGAMPQRRVTPTDVFAAARDPERVVLRFDTGNLTLAPMGAPPK